MRRALSCGAAIAVLLLAGCARKPKINENDPALRQGCLMAAGAIIGGEVELLQFGRLGANAPLDCVVAGTLEDAPQGGEGTYASQLLILRYQGQMWRVALNASKWVTNPEGYLGIESIDDAYDFKGLRVALDDKSPARQPGITVWITYLDDDGEDEGPAKEFGLNPATGRYQEFDERTGYKPELKDPPHIRSR